MRKILITIMALFICLNMANLADAATYSGSCGGNVNWHLDTSTGILTVSGSGGYY